MTDCNKGWDVVGPGNMPTKGSDVVTPRHAGGRSLGGGPRGTGSSRGPREADPRDTQNPGECRPEQCPHPTWRAHNPVSKPEAERRTERRADPGERALGGQWGPARWWRLRTPWPAPGSIFRAQVADPRGWWLMGGRYEGGRKGGCSPAFKYTPAPSKCCSAFR